MAESAAFLLATLTLCVCVCVCVLGVALGVCDKIRTRFRCERTCVKRVSVGMHIHACRLDWFSQTGERADKAEWRSSTRAVGYGRVGSVHAVDHGEPR